MRKREELAVIRAALAERELELVNLRIELAAFEGRYVRQVGVLYAELDDWKAKLAALQARLHPTPASQEQAEQAREQARQTYQEAHGEAASTPDFTPSPELKKALHSGRYFWAARATRSHPCWSTSRTAGNTWFDPAQGAAQHAASTRESWIIVVEFLTDTAAR
jgi:hypothetical protein